jgi:hypothetical protein
LQVEAWASMKTFSVKNDSPERPAGGASSVEADFPDEARSNEMHANLGILAQCRRELLR